MNATALALASPLPGLSSRRSLLKFSVPRPDIDVESNHMSAVPNARNVRSIHARNLSSNGLAQIVADALNRAFAGHKSVVKAVMEVANCNERAAENWLEGRNAPNAVYLLRLMAEVPELQAEIRRLTAMETDLDPHFERALSDTFAVFMKMKEGR